MMTTTERQPPALRRLEARAGTSTYIIEIGTGVRSRLTSVLDHTHLPKRRFIVSSSTVWRLHGASFAEVTDDEPVLLPDGERHKQLATVSRIYDALIKARADRATTIIAVGGGVVGDIAGLAAATYLRGVPVVHVPTTLLAQVDSAIGGKVGVNHPLGKNLIGAFHQPSAVIVDPAFLATLPRREFRAGLYEVVKYGMIASRPLFDRIGEQLTLLFARQDDVLAPIIAECCQIKATIVEGDERESGPRRALNFGHTIAHALESTTKYRRFRHGEAVAYGMLAAAEVAAARGVLPGPDRSALATLIAQMGPLPPVSDLDPAQVLEAVARDKKVVSGKLHFVLPTTIGATTTACDISMEELAKALAAVRLSGGRTRGRPTRGDAL
jgi:3-dehydroquinate synthase